jgi:hypothetical protein
MASGYSRSPFLLKGAIVQFAGLPIIPLPIPNIILFQYNPDSISRSLKPFNYSDKQKEDMLKSDPKAFDQPFDPEENFNVTLFLDATDALETPDSFPHQIAVATGVADRLAALEQLLYPEGSSRGLELLGSLVGAIGGKKVDPTKQVKRPKTPITLFVWGTGTIVPVRLTSFNVEEQWWNFLLYPLRAKVTIGMKVVTSAELYADKDRKISATIAGACYDFTRVQKEILALLNIANTIESVGAIAKSIPGV